MSNSAAERRVSFTEDVVPGLASMLINDGCTESISAPVGPLGGSGEGDAPCTDVAWPSNTTAAVARPPSRRRVGAFMCSFVLVTKRRWGRPAAAPDGLRVD